MDFAHPLSRKRDWLNHTQQFGKGCRSCGRSQLPSACCRRQVDELRAELARSHQRCCQLEADLLGLDAAGHAGGADTDAEMRKAWRIVATFKKRCVPSLLGTRARWLQDCYGSMCMAHYVHGASQ